MDEMGIDIALSIARHAQCHASVGGRHKRMRDKVVEHARCPALHKRLAREEFARPSRLDQ